jgi:hypothetical protein
MASLVDIPGSEEKESAQSRKNRSEVRNQEKQPGLLVFRHLPTPSPKFDHRLLSLFVAGETPTAGINGSEFRNARAYMKALAKTDTPVIRIQGPTFLGSFLSLSQLINDDRKHRDRKYIVRTGTAISDNDVAAFRAAIAAKLDFFAANESLLDQTSHFCAVLGDLHILRNEAAFLVEDETGLAHYFNDPPICFTGGEPVRVLRFPREISNLRNAYREVVDTARSEKAPTPDVNFSLKDSESGEDSVPVFSKTQTPLSENAVLGEIINEIQRDRIRIVDVVATNVLDLMFLAGGWSELNQPPAWLMTLNRFGFSPVKVMPSKAAKGWSETVQLAKDPELRLPNPPQIWTLVLCLFVYAESCLHLAGSSIYTLILAHASSPHWQ